MLLLLFQIGNDRYALEARHAVEVIPLVALNRLPQAPRGVVGVFNYRGRPVPALDMCLLLTGRAARERLSTRILVVQVAEEAGGSQWLGLIVEHATGMMRREAGQFAAPGVDAVQAPFLRGVLLEEQGLIQLLEPRNLLSSALRRYLAAPVEVASHEAG